MTTTGDRFAIYGGWVLQEEGFVRSDLLILGDTIRQIGRVDLDPADRTLDATGHWIVPGFIDLHVHGGAGADFADGDPVAADRILAFHAQHGTTRALGSLVPMEPDRMAAAVRRLSETPIPGLLGLHLEGPFVAESRCGALSRQHLRAPNRTAFADLISASRKGAVRMMTYAPELPGAGELLAAILESGAIAAIGHSDATHEETITAVHAGARHVTHLFNAMRGLHHREPGVAGAALVSRALSLELIADGLHLHPAILQLVIEQLAGQDQLSRLCLVSDAIRAAGCPDGDYQLGDQEVKVEDSAARLADGTLAGSLLTLDKALRNAMAASGRPLEEAVQWITSNPARVLGEHRLGALSPGFLADLVLLDAEQNVAMTFRDGRCLFDGRTHA